MNDISKGICIFAYNNEKIDYIRLSIICAILAKKNLNLPIALITDKNTLGYVENHFDKKLLKYCFNYFIVEEVDKQSNKRIHKDSPWYEFVAPFINSNKHDIIKLSPFEKTLLIDSDYLILNNNLLKLFDSNIDLAAFKNALSIRNDPMLPNEIFLHPMGIKMIWSTVIYFTKSKLNYLFFDLWEHVKNNYEYYQMIYKFPKGLYRTDYAVSIANHILSGRNSNDFIQDIPQQNLYNSYQEDDLFDVKKDKLYFLANDQKENWKDIPVCWTNQDVHVMNKWAILRNYDKFVNNYDIQ